MGGVAGADEAGQTPQASDRMRQTADQAQPATGPASGAATQPTSGLATQPASGSATGPASGAPTQSISEQAQPEIGQHPQSPGFGERGRMRRRARFLRKARELGYRDLGGLVFDLHRFGQRNDQLVLAKLAALGHIDTELRELEGVLRDRRPVTVLHEAGIAACPRCAAIHGSEDRFCPGCGLAFDTNADRPISTAPVSPHQAQTPPPSHTPTAPLAPGAALGGPATTQPANQLSPIPAPSSQPQSPAPAPPAPPTGGPGPPFERPAQSNADSAPPVKTTATPVAAKPGAPPSEPSAPKRVEEDEPTQILRPPATGR